MKRAWEIVHLAVVALLICIAFFGLARVWAAVAHAEHSTKDFWDVATAISTCAAVVVALGISLRDGRLRIRDELLQGKLNAAGTSARLRVAQSYVSVCLDFVRNPESQNAGESKFNLHANLLTQCPVISNDEIRGLAFLPNNCGARIAAAFDRIHLAREFMNRLTEMAAPPANNTNRQSDLEFAAKQLAEAYGLLEDAGTTVSQAARSLGLHSSFKPRT
ncbi:hypothetical protein [Burkholderia sp. AU16741]|uniref:hypothetical protein n=1 Tax=Burkholderia sp. AU16741 TaxID=2015347 RepID=UPI00117F0676|nr:hypothetical protein [Burkholderia sp. AU16741]